ncbi:MAG: HD domain-containing protein [Peptoniphilaceae bacterium]|nr:HD domain-containing protein [Peptoniphilaceae bacterium]MDY3738655.1 HD domain-containing protein [Peptoniphilaceae bacterium]
MIILKIINGENEVTNEKHFVTFKKTVYFDKLKEYYSNLNTEILFKSFIHGQGHIERVMLFAMMLSEHYNLNKKDSDILMNASSYHDIGRVNDRYDLSHGKRASEKIAIYTKLSGEDLEILKATVTAHSLEDSSMEKVIESYNIENKKRAIYLAKMFKDCDGLDRVRISDLDENFLRNDYSKELVDFSKILYKEYNSVKE